MSEAAEKRHNRWCYETAKRAVDVGLCLAAIPILLPWLIVCAILIKLDSVGPVFYLGERAGKAGRPFKIMKFRTMVVNAERLGGGTTALHDPRITRIGGFLRKYKLDELPQIFNVIKGDMSIVGPRPELLQYTSQYVGEEKIILTVRPGITDFSSIQFSDLAAHVGATDADRAFEERILPSKNRLRIDYVKNRSMTLDIMLIFKTLHGLLGRVGTSLNGIHSSG
jgi:lipopolysaccharide/colanic/teichoic acid biosynthesis glycosyltransferase